MTNIYSYNAENGQSIYTIYHKGIPFTGKAYVAPVDEDMKNEKTGLFIAEARANLAYLKYVKNNELKPKLSILRHLADSFDKSSHASPRSYENKLTHKQLHVIEKQLTAIEQEIADEEQFLKFYIEKKDLMYKRMRDRKAKNN